MRLQNGRWILLRGMEGGCEGTAGAMAETQEDDEVSLSN